MHAWLSIEGQLHILDFQQSLSGQCRWLKCSGDQPRLWQYFGHQGLALTLDLLLYSCFPTSVFQFLIWLQTLPYHQFSFSLVSVLTSLSAHLILSKAFPSHFLPVDVVLYPLHFSWIVSFCAVLWNDSHRCCKSEYPKIKFKAADVSVGIEPDWACSSHTSVGKVTSNLLHSEFGTDNSCGVPPWCWHWAATTYFFLFSSSLTYILPHFPGCFPLFVDPHRRRESQIVLWNVEMSVILNQGL